MVLRKTTILSAMLAFGLVAVSLGFATGDGTSVRAQGFPRVHVDLGFFGCGLGCPGGVNITPPVLPPIDGVIYLPRPGQQGGYEAWQLWIAEGGYCGNDESQGSCGLPPGLYFSSESQHGPWTPHPDGSDEDFYHPNLPGGYWYLFTDINYRTLTLTSAPADWQ